MDHRNQLAVSLKPFIIFSSIFGFCPFTIKITSLNSVKFSIFKLIYGIIVGAVSVVYIGFSSFMLDDDSEVFSSGVAKFVGMVYPVMTFIILSGFLINSKNFTKTIEDFFNLATVLTRKTFYSKYFWLIITEILILEILLIIHHTLYGFETFQSKYKIFSIAEIFSSCMLTHSISITIIWFGTLLYFLKNVIMALNIDLYNIGPIMIFVPKGKYKLYHDRSKFDTWLMDKSKEDIDLTSLIMIYDQVIGTCASLNKCFNMTITGYTVLAMLELVLSIYEIVADPTRIKTAIIWIFVVVIIEYFLLFSCEKVVEEVSMIIINKF